MIILQDDEKKLFEVRRHPIIFILAVVFLLFTAFIPLILAFTGQQFLPNIDLSSADVYLLLLGYVVWLILIWILIFIQWTNYFLDVWIITNKRIIDFQYRGFFSYEVSSLRLERIQDITVDVSGVLGNIFGFGTLLVETAGAKKDNFYIYNAASPNEVKNKIFELCGKIFEQERPTINV